MNHGHFILGVVLVLGLFATISLFDQVNTTGAYYYGNAGMGRWYTSGGWVQLEPAEACDVVGAKSFDPPRVVFNDYKQAMVLCYRYTPGDAFVVPLVQWANPVPNPLQYNPLP